MYSVRQVSSRMVCRWKPREGILAQNIGRNRWCVRSHQDPDTEILTQAPTSQTPGSYASMPVASCDICDIAVGDPKNKLWQTSELQRKGGPLFVESCDGTPGLEAEPQYECVKCDQVGFHPRCPACGWRVCGNPCECDCIMSDNNEVFQESQDRSLS